MLRTFISDLKAVSGVKKKKAVLQEYDLPELKTLLRYAFTPYSVFNVSIKRKEIPSAGVGDLISDNLFEEAVELLEECTLSASHKKNREKVVAFLSRLDEGNQELFLGVLNKNLKCGLALRGVNDVFPGLIDVQPVQLAAKYDKDAKYKRLTAGWWYWSYKIDGRRVLAFREDGEWTLYSRYKDWRGQKITTCQHVLDVLEDFYAATGFTFLDGEIYKHGHTFEEINGAVASTNLGPYAADWTEYHIFIAGQAEDFYAHDDRKFVLPMEDFGEVIKSAYMPDDHIIESTDEIAQKVQMAIDQNYEGIMLRSPEIIYEWKRSDALLKVKTMFEDGKDTADCEVIGIVYDEFPVIENEKQITERLPVKLLVEQENGLICGVGTGFTLPTRRDIVQSPEKYLGRTAEILYDKYGTRGLMRFPVYQHIRHDK